MGIHTIFIPLLICIGISGYTDAQGYNLNLISVAQSFFPIADMMDKQEVFVRLVHKTCEKNGGSGAFMIASGKTQNVAQCIASLKIPIDQSFAPKDKKEILLARIGAFCPQVSYLKSCMNEFKKNNPCLGPVELESVEVFIHVFISVLKFGCNNNGENFKKLINEGGSQCLDIANNKMGTCTKQAFTDKMRKYISKESSTSEPQEFPLFVPDKDDCARLEKVIDCYLHALQQCGKPEVTNVMKDLYSETLVGFRCKNSVNWQSSPVNSQSSPVSFIILVFVTAVTALRL